MRVQPCDNVPSQRQTSRDACKPRPQAGVTLTQAAQACPLTAQGSAKQAVFGRQVADPRPHPIGGVEPAANTLRT
ncbi:hypothetical protein GCM10010254_22260 [Streptomyces chromofuscus]|nr:hypothetical protein GCM10010254_22260 [Streptomyces chromofuscus]